MNPQTEALGGLQIMLVKYTFIGMELQIASTVLHCIVLQAVETKVGVVSTLPLPHPIRKLRESPGYLMHVCHKKKSKKLKNSNERGPDNFKQEWLVMEPEDSVQKSKWRKVEFWTHRYITLD